MRFLRGSFLFVCGILYGGSLFGQGVEREFKYPGGALRLAFPGTWSVSTREGFEDRGVKELQVIVLESSPRYGCRVSLRTYARYFSSDGKQKLDAFYVRRTSQPPEALPNGNWYGRTAIDDREGKVSAEWYLSRHAADGALLIAEFGCVFEQGNAAELIGTFTTSVRNAVLSE